MYLNSSYKVLLYKLIPHQKKSPGPFTIYVASAFQKEKSTLVLHSDILQDGSAVRRQGESIIRVEIIISNHMLWCELHISKKLLIKFESELLDG